MTEEKEMPTESNGQEEAGKENVDYAIRRQIEYYFSDVNLPRDKFLKEQTSLDDGWVPFDILIKFHRLARITTDTEKIANALNNTTSCLLEVSEDNKKVRRRPDIPVPEMNEERRKEIMSRTVYAKGFPKDATLDDLLQFFKQYEEVINVIMRKYVERQTKSRIFKGSVFATFKTKEQAEKFMETKDVKYNDTELVLLWQDKYLEQKQEEFASKKEKRDKKKKTKTEEGKDEKEEPALVLPTGTILHFTVNNEKMRREDVKDAVTFFDPDVAYIDFQVGNKQGYVRLAKEDAAKAVFDKLDDGKLIIINSEVVFRLVEGDEEKKYLNKTIEEMTKRRKNHKNFKQKSRNFKGGNKQKKRKLEQADEDGPKAKVKAEDS